MSGGRARTGPAPAKALGGCRSMSPQVISSSLPTSLAPNTERNSDVSIDIDPGTDESSHYLTVPAANGPAQAIPSVRFGMLCWAFGAVVNDTLRIGKSGEATNADQPAAAIASKAGPSR